MKTARVIGGLALFAVAYAAAFNAFGARASQEREQEQYAVDGNEPVVPVPPGTNVGPRIPALSTTTWTPLGPAPLLNGQRPGNGPVSGRLTGIAADPTDANILYVAAAGGGVWKTTDGGAAWTPLLEGEITQSIGAIAVAPSNSSVVYVGTGEANNSGDSNFGRGVLVSTNGGTSWTLSTAMGAFDRKTISEIAVDPTNANVAYVAVVGGSALNGNSGSSGIWKTGDGGSSWSNTTTSITTTEFFSSIRIDPNAPLTLYAAVGSWYGAAVNGIYKTTNGGMNWSLLTNAPKGTSTGRMVVAVAKSNSQVVYVSVQSSTTLGFGKLVRSDDGGATFPNDLTAGTPNYMGGQGWYDTTLIVDPTNSAIVYVSGAAGTNSILRSINSGASWTDIANTASGAPHADHHAAAFDATGRYVEGDDGGVYLLDTASPAHWTQLNGNLNTIQFQGIALHPTDPSIAFGGSQDNGTSKYSGTLGWTLVEGGDGGFVRFSKTNPSRVYHVAPVASFGGSSFFRRSDSGGTSGWVSRTTGFVNTNTFQFYPPFVVDPGNGDRLLIGGDRMYESTNGADLWTPISTPSTAGWTTSNPIQAIGLAPSESNTIYAATSGHLFVTTNHGASWTDHPLPVSGTVGDIQVSATNAQVAYAVVRAFTTGANVFKTINGGTSWTALQGSVPPPAMPATALPSLPVWSIQIDPNVPGRLYAGSDDGVYVSYDDGGSWARLASGLPKAQVYHLELNRTLNLLAAGTHGRGLWELSVAPAPFTDDPLVAGTTLIKAQHINELRSRVNTARAARNMMAATFTDVPLVGGSAIKAIHVAELRTAIDQIYAHDGRSHAPYGDATITAGMAVKAQHIAELRTFLAGAE